MSEPIKNRYEFVVLFDVENGIGLIESEGEDDRAFLVGHA